MIALQGREPLEAQANEMRRLQHRLSATPWARSSAQALEDWARRNFAAEGALLEAPSGSWPARRLASGRTAGTTRRLLDNTGRLRRSLRLRAVPGGQAVEFTAPYAAAHHFGRGLPRRALLPDAAQTDRLLQPILAKTLREILVAG